MIKDALLIIDLQNGVCPDPEDTQVKEIIALTNYRIDKYRQSSQPIIFIQHEDEELVPESRQWQLLSELDTRPTDLFVGKTHADSFYHTDLQGILDSLSVQSLEIVGAQTEYCMDATIKAAYDRGYQIQLIADGWLTYDNSFMTAEQTNRFFQGIWQDRFADIISETE
ncbi:cysteine hydrolase family protein [Enterococcus mediterraneensis]|uniref:cysteine hydrolase family protein n=1 Tax=Enterococcus mediterraneensis TaxID=2364791 RepID=UPI0019D12CFE|nr:cysteine hydrolase family protein [Enterococcus mediterraneensis]